MNKPSRTKSDAEKELDAAAAKEIKRHIKAEMLTHNVDMATVAERLTAMGRAISEQGLRNKISSCTHQTTWYWDLMKAIKGNI
ncbi:hypothetical protein SG34_012965 [Thalassomonas viridans]|uniref:DUF6471 domain-containing protein n=1 Tax=Thalassomonas viridans TaxID=137584 RepID=A0AAE9Z7T1_9GAMM|nr:DUF6471 domain-containing protein [Thalassomonas viridans]WDE07719.1 hypothetical protein SG34_012965 [Thalassomonas viridans]